MKSSLSHPRPAHPPTVLTLAHLLERLDSSPETPDAGQYRAVVTHLIQEFASPSAAPMLDAVLDSYPSAAELYENVQYQHAGLCRSALEFAMDAERQARDAITKARRQADL